MARTPTRRSAVHGPTTAERRWAAILEEWRGSKLEGRAFCRERGLRESSFWFWKREIPERLARRRAARTTPKLRFLRVGCAEPTASPPAPIELTLPGGRTLRIGSGFDAEALRRLLAVLETAP